MDWLNILDQVFDVCLIPFAWIGNNCSHFLCKTENGRE